MRNFCARSLQPLVVVAHPSIDCRADNPIEKQAYEAHCDSAAKNNPEERQSKQVVAH
jgi:hypothetical protein